MICLQDGCEKEARVRGYCQKHYTYNITHRIIPVIKANKPRFCSVYGCNNKHYCKGYCGKHYSRIKYHGDIDRRPRGGGAKTYHILTNVNFEKRRATCSLCGENSYIYQRHGTWVCCMNSIKKSREIQEKRGRWVANFKESIGCFYCGYNTNHFALQFHHINPDEKEGLVSYSKGRESTMAEIKKCIVICANCHMILHNNGIFGKQPIPIGEWILPEDMWDSMP